MWLKVVKALRANTHLACGDDANEQLNMVSVSKKGAVARQLSGTYQPPSREFFPPIKVDIELG